jgi:succinyl-diaminopimelate desuccinylase
MARKSKKRSITFAKLGTDFGFKVDKVDGYCTELSFGEAGPFIGIYGHSDVVPATGKWTSGPFEAKVEGEKMVGRGTADDKGPLDRRLYRDQSF